MFRSIFTDDLDLTMVGEDFLDMTAYAYEKGHEFRQSHPNIPICDIDYADLVQDPLRAVEHIYQFFGDRLSPEATREMNQWIAANPQGKHGVHRYSLEQFGLSEATVRERFA